MSADNMRLSVDLDRLAATPLERDPFDHVVVPHFVTQEALTNVLAAFPNVEQGGSFPVASLDCGPAFQTLVSDLQGAAVRDAFSEKFDMDLEGRPTMVTVRGQSRKKDGRIHSDSKSKMITALIYLNRAWNSQDGRLRLLRGQDDIDNYVADIEPVAGVLVAFRCAPNAYHGYKRFVGPRASLQLNWLTDEAVLERELSRHGLSAKVKRWTGLGG